MSVLLLGDPRLRQPGLDVDFTTFRDDAALQAEFKQLIDTLLKFKQQHGFGRAIASTQLGFTRRFIACSLAGTSGEAVAGPAPFIMINPRIIWHSEQMQPVWDDCMSFPWIMVKVLRYSSIAIDFTHAGTGEYVKWDNMDFPMSELFQHEIDHLDGVLAVDKPMKTVTGDSIVAREIWLQNRDMYEQQLRDDYALRSAPRCWTATNALSVMQFNTLAEIYQFYHDHPHVNFPFRAPRIKQSIESFGCDVVSINECNPVTWYRQNFQHKYNIYFVARSDHWQITKDEMYFNQRTDADGTAIMLKKGVVEVIDAHRIGCKEPEPNSDVWAGHFALAMHAYHIPSKKTFWIVSMHMKASCGGVNECPRRVHHLKQILSDLRSAVNARDPAAPVIFCGDFNAEPDEATIDFIEKKRCVLKDGGGVHHQTWFDFESALQPHQCETTYLYGELGAAQTTWNSVLDYIYVEKGKFIVSSVVPTPKRDDPSLGINAYQHCGSDHFPIAVELCFV